MAIEVECKGLISEEKYHKVLAFLKEHATFVGEQSDETHYFHGEHDLRIHKNQERSKIVLKKGVLHDEMREELEVKTHLDEFDNLKKLFDDLGYTPEVKWFRKRNTFEWEGVKVDVDHTKGFGFMVEIEKMAEEDTKDEALKLVKEKFQKLGVTITPRDELKAKFEQYRDNWKTLTE